MKAQDLKLNKFMNFTKDIGFLEKLKSTDEEFTLFAPTDEAFEGEDVRFMVHLVLIEMGAKAKII